MLEWHLYKSVVGEQRVSDNTWGDAIISIFIDPKVAVKAMMDFIEACDKNGLALTIGMTFASTFVVDNIIRHRKDLLGDEVNFAARIEQSNKIPNSICICQMTHERLSQEVKNQFSEIKMPVTKPFLGYSVGDTCLVYQFILYPQD